MQEILKGIEDQPIVQENCGDCGIGIILDNDSGWHCFILKGVAPLCCDCMKKRDTIREKSED